MGDRFTRGLIAGIIAGIVPFIFNFGAKMLNFSTLVWADFMGLFVLGRRPEGTGEMIFTIILQFFLLGIMGVVFAFIISLFSSQNYWLKGTVFGGSIWFLIYFLTFVFKLPGIEQIPIKTAISNLIGGLLWGFALSISLNWLDDRLKT